MANELKHGSVGTELTQAEWEGVGAHVFNSQATGDIVYASSSSQLSRLAKGTDTHVLILSSGVPAWSTSTGITALGTIATGVWQGTDVGVAYGGTGVSTLTDGGVLLGSGGSAITAMAVLTDGQMIVGDGTTDPVAESGATLRTSIGVGTGDSPSFGTIYINDSANANMTTGLTINQGASDDQIFALKSSDVAHGRTGYAETDTFAFLQKASGTLGGLYFVALAEDGAIANPLYFDVIGGTATTDKDTSAAGLVTFHVAEHNGSNAVANITADGNVFVIQARVGGSDVTRFLVDEDGDLYSVTSAQTFDEYDDALMVRALDQAKGNVIRSHWDDYVTYNEQALIDADVLGAPVAEGGLTNVTQLQRLHNGAIWQGYVRQQEMQEKIDTLENRLLAIEGAK